MSHAITMHQRTMIRKYGVVKAEICRICGDDLTTCQNLTAHFSLGDSEHRSFYAQITGMRIGDPVILLESKLPRRD